MKTRIFLLIAGAAVVTLSFTFATTSNIAKKETTTVNQKQNFDAPAGGLALEEK
jgi:hypothetical protein